MADVDVIYADLIGRCLAGERVLTRNARCRRAVCPPPAEFTTTPLVSARRTAWRTALREWEWFMGGTDQLQGAHESVRPWWAPYADSAGVIAHSYGRQLRRWGGHFDQIERLVAGLRAHPSSRRHVVTTWNAADMAHPATPLTTCHGTAIQCFVEGGALTLFTYQRSADVIVGLPHNWVSYWAFLLWLSSRAGLRRGRLIYQIGDAHVYEAHEALARRVEGAAPRCRPIAPVLLYEPTSEEFRESDFSLGGEYAPAIDERAPMIV